MSANDPARAFLDFLHLQRETLEDRLAAFKQAFDLCESPIEQHFLAFCFDVFDVWHSIDINDIERLCLRLCQWDDLTINLTPQHSVIVEDRTYRLDFLLQAERTTPNALGGIDHIGSFLFDIELDGHDFHERTKEQAIRDRRRDRALMRNGYTVLRFTGREIHRDMYAVLGEIHSSVLAIATTQPEIESLPIDEISRSVQ